MEVEKNPIFHPFFVGIECSTLIEKSCNNLYRPKKSRCRNFDVPLLSLRDQGYNIGKERERAVESL